MVIFVDFDNIARKDSRKGLVYIVNKILSKIDPSELKGDTHVIIRLYGGWYEQNRFTNRAQNLSIDISKNFPTILNLSDNRTRVFVNCEMAYSILADPYNHLFHTYRPRGMPENLKVRTPKSIGCTRPDCPLIFVYDFISNNICDKCRKFKPSDFFYRGEQKLVDTMITSDLIFSSSKNSTLCIVSSDDDFWPGIMTVLYHGKKVIHIHTKNNRRTPSYYSKNAGNNYIQKNI